MLEASGTQSLLLGVRRKGYRPPNTVFVARIGDGRGESEPVDQDALKRACQTIVNRHAILRTAFAYQGSSASAGGAKRAVHERMEADFKIIHTHQQDGQEFRDQLYHACHDPFRPETAHVFRVRLLTKPSAGPTRAPTATFESEDMKSPLDKEIILVLAADAAVCDSILCIPSGLHLYLQEDSPANTTTMHKKAAFRLSSNATEALRKMANKLGVTLTAVMLAIYEVYLHQYTSSTILLLGIQLPARVEPEVTHIVGPFSNTVPMRMDLSDSQLLPSYAILEDRFYGIIHPGDPAFKSLVHETQRNLTKAEAHQECPLATLLKETSNRLSKNDKKEVVQSPASASSPTPPPSLSLSSPSAAAADGAMMGIRIAPDATPENLHAIEPSSLNYFLVFAWEETPPSLTSLGTSTLNAMALGVEAKTTSMGGMQLTPLEVPMAASPGGGCLVALNAGIVHGKIAGKLVFQTDVLERDSGKRMARHFEELASSLAATGEAATSSMKISDLSMVSREEYDLLLGTFNGRKKELPKKKFLHHLVEDAVLQHPDTIAIESKLGSLTYKELNDQANCLARYLRFLSVGIDRPVPVMMPRSPKLFVVLLAILKSGGCCMPLDPDYPESRLKYMLRESQQVATAPEILEVDDTIFWETIVSPGNNRDNLASMPSASTSDLAYLLYTSGSTGKPKGVMLRHCGLVNYVLWHIEFYEQTSEDRAGHVASTAFDASMAETWPTLCSGGTLVLLPDSNIRLDPKLLCEWYADEGIHISFLTTQLAESVLALGSASAPSTAAAAADTPAVKKSMADAGKATNKLLVPTPTSRSNVDKILDAASGSAYPKHLRLRILFTGGDKLHGGPPKSAPFELVNIYGPTEATINVTLCKVPHGQATPPPIGKPVPNMRVYILTQNLKPCPLGVYGDLYIAGVQLARGYLNRPDLTRERFLPDPFFVSTREEKQGVKEGGGREGGPEESRMYKTGDVARFLPSGEVEFLGRRDTQVKIRGYRIELGEIETVLISVPEISAATVIARGEEDSMNSGKILVAYIVPVNSIGVKLKGTNEDKGQQTEVKEDKDSMDFIRLKASDAVKAALPAYMVPTAYVVLPSLPLTPNGKIKRNALPAPCAQDMRATDGKKHYKYTAPSSKAECLIADAVADTLGLSRTGISMSDSFFSLGGHSLSVSRLLSRIRILGIMHLSITDVYKSPTLKDLASLLTDEQATNRLALLRGGGDVDSIEKTGQQALVNNTENTEKLVSDRDRQNNNTLTPNIDSGERKDRPLLLLEDEGRESDLKEENAPYSSLSQAPNFTMTLEQIEKMYSCKDQEGMHLSFNQESMYTQHRRNSNASRAYNTRFAAEMKREEVDFKRLRKCLWMLHKHHTSLRTRFSPGKDGDSPRQHIVPLSSFEMDYVEIDDFKQQSQNLLKEVRNLASKRFDLEKGNVSRIIIAHKQDGKTSIFTWAIHHISIDLWSFAELLSSLGKAYASTGNPSMTVQGPPPLQYIQVVPSLRNWESERKEKVHGFWQQTLAPPLPVLDMPLDRPRPPKQSYRGASMGLDIPPELATRIRALAMGEGVSLNTLMLTAYFILLQKYTHQDDLIVGVPTAGRDQLEHERCCGYFVNPVPLRLSLIGDPRFVDTLKRAHLALTQAMEHSTIPIAELVKSVVKVGKRDTSRPMLFQTLFVTQKPHKLGNEGLAFFFTDTPGVSLQLEAHDSAATKSPPSGGSHKLEMKSFVLGQEFAEYDIAVMIAESPARLAASFQYNTDIFNKDTINRFSRHYLAILSSIVRNPSAYLSKVSAVPPCEYRDIMRWNSVKLPFQTRKCLHEIVEETVQRHPDSVAVEGVVGGGKKERQQFTYRKLNEKANQLAHYLRFKGVESNSLVLILLKRCPTYIVSLLAVLKAGGACVPIDPKYPPERIKHIVELAGSNCLVLTEKKLFEEKFPNFFSEKKNAATSTSSYLQQQQQQQQKQQRPYPLPPLFLDSDSNLSKLLARGCTENLPRAPNLSPESTAFVIFTSGSTGKPKGVMLRHRGLAAYIAWHIEKFEMSQSDRVSHLASVAFDASMAETWPTLAIGGTLVQIPAGERRVVADSKCFDRWITENKITVSFLPTVVLEAFLDMKHDNCHHALRLVFTGGDKLHRGPQKGAKYAVLNNYGPCENTIGCTCIEVPFDYKPPPFIIGSPAPNTQLFVLDDHRQMCPIGVSGEIYLGGQQLAKGYLARKDLTNQRFVASPFNPSERIYKTGDMGRYLPGGQVEFLGRRDTQVKIRGNRIEMGEVEAAFLSFKGVREVCVVCREDDDGAGGRPRKSLVAYVVPQSGFLTEQNSYSKRKEGGEKEKTNTGKEMQASRTSSSSSNGRKLGQNDHRLDLRSLRGHLRATLPEFMVPSAIVVLERFPLTPNAKIDRRGLPRPESDDVAAGADRIAPRTPAETTVISVAEQVLGLPKNSVGMNDNFFDLGGHSLLAAKLVSHLEVQLTITVPFAAIFDEPNFGALTRRITLARSNPNAAQRIQDIKVIKREESNTVEIGTPRSPFGDYDSKFAAPRLSGDRKQMRRSNSSFTMLTQSSDGNRYGPKSYKDSPMSEFLQQQQHIYDENNMDAAAVPSNPLTPMRLVSEDTSAAVGIMDDDITQQTEGTERAGTDIVINSGNSPRTARLAPPASALATSPFSYSHLTLGTTPLRTRRGGFAITPSAAASNETPLHRGGDGNSSVASREVAGAVSPSLQFEPGEGYMTYNQQSLWFMHSLDVAASNAYKCSFAMEVAGDLNGGKACTWEDKYTTIRAAFQRLVDSHSSLRTSFCERRGQPVQKIRSPGSPVDIKVVEEEGKGGARSRWQHNDNSKNLLLQAIQSELEEPFDLETGPIARMRIFPLSPSSSSSPSSPWAVIVFVAHHIVVDGWSVKQILLPKFKQYLQNEIRTPSSSLLEITQDFESDDDAAGDAIDYALWQQGLVRGGEGRRLWNYWKRQLAGPLPTLEIPTDFPRPPRQSFEGGLYSIDIPNTLAAKLMATSKKERATLFMIFAAAYFTLLHRYTSQVDIIVGTPMACRGRSDVESLVAHLVNPVALRINISGDPSLKELIKRIRTATVGAFTHQELPFPLIAERIQKYRDSSRNPVFQALFALNQFSSSKHENINSAQGDEKSSSSPEISHTCPRFESVDLGEVGSPFDLQFIVDVNEPTNRSRGESAKITAKLQYASRLFLPQTIEFMGRHLMSILNAIVTDSTTPVSKVLLVSRDEKKMLHQWGGYDDSTSLSQKNGRNDTGRRTGGGVLASILGAATRFPSSLALCSKTSHLTYRGLLELSAHIATEIYGKLRSRLREDLKNDSTGSCCVVGVMMQRSTVWIASIIAVWLLGAAYVPIDPDYPQARIQHMLKDSSAVALLIDKDVGDDDDNDNKDNGANATTAKVKGISSIVIPISGKLRTDDGKVPNGYYHREWKTPKYDPTSLAYIIYTSGSTGRPKGVMVPHGALASVTSSMKREYKIQHTHRTTQLFGPGFDPVGLELWPFLTSGASIHVVPELLRKDPPSLVKWIKRQQITHCQTPTPIAHAMMKENWENTALQVMSAGGEKLMVDFMGETTEFALKSANENVCRRPFRFDNHYGPSECTIIATLFKVPVGFKGGPPIGRPILGCFCLVLETTSIRHGDDGGDATNKRTAPQYCPLLAPIGVFGELCLAGDHLAKGYLNLPEKTSKTFVNHPNYGRIYRTGDRARWNRDGYLEFGGRLDRQVKVRGFRIELGEIETALLSASSAVKQVAVCVRKKSGDYSGEALVAYVVLGDSKSSRASQKPEHLKNHGVLVQKLELSTEDEATLRASAKEALPEYMVPSVFIRLSRFPLTPNGKLDRKALPMPNWSEIAARNATNITAFVEPEGAYEIKAAQVWKSVLAVDVIGANDSFFDLGGNSLTASSVIVGLRDAFGITLTISDLFENPSVRGVVRRIKIIKGEKDDAVHPSNIGVDEKKASQIRSNSTELSSTQKAMLEDIEKILGEIKLQEKYPDSISIHSLELKNVNMPFTAKIQPKPVEESQTVVFLTGATGFLGTFILAELLKLTNATIYCVVRCKSKSSASTSGGSGALANDAFERFPEADDRIQESLEKYGLFYLTANRDRVFGIPGDLKEPRLGLNKKIFKTLSNRVDWVIHCGAWVNSVLPYSQLRTANVFGTKEVLRLATSGRKLALVSYISTLSVFDAGRGKKIKETDELPAVTRTHGGYPQTKWVSERLMLACNEKGIPCEIYRPGRITGNSRTGHAATEDFQCRLIKGCIQLGAYPDLDWIMDMTPVDYVSRSIVTAGVRGLMQLEADGSSSQQTSGWSKPCSIYHLCNPNPIQLSQLFQWLYRFGFPVKETTYTQWREMIIQAAKNSSAPKKKRLTIKVNEEQKRTTSSSDTNIVNPLVAVLPLLLPEKQKMGDRKTMPLFDTSNTEARLTKISEELMCPAITDDLLDTYFGYFVSSRFLPAPNYDQFQFEMDKY
eukprot:jgi/Bigna1/82242/fgenesh1_pg.89_\